MFRNIQWDKKLPQCLCILERLVLCEGVTKVKILKMSHDILEHVDYLPNEKSCDSNKNSLLNKSNKIINHWDSFLTHHLFQQYVRISFFFSLYFKICHLW